MTERITKPTNVVCARACRFTVTCKASMVKTGASSLFESYAVCSCQRFVCFASQRARVNRDRMLRYSQAIFHRIFNALSIQSRISNARAITVRPLNPPTAAGWNQLHLASSPPPLIDFAGQCHPEFVVFNDLSQIGEQRLIHSACLRGRQIIGMGDETDQSVSFLKQGDLLLPEVNRIFVQYLKERIVLAGGERNLQNLADKIREDRTATAALRFQMRYVRHRHIVGKFVRIVPIEIAIHDSRSKPLGAKFLNVLIDLLGPLQEQFALLVQLPVMIQVVYVELKPATAHVPHIFIGNFVTFFRDNLERGFNSVRMIKSD